MQSNYSKIPTLLTTFRKIADTKCMKKKHLKCKKQKNLILTKCQMAALLAARVKVNNPQIADYEKLRGKKLRKNERKKGRRKKELN